MDRFSIIQQVFNKPVADETSNCGQDKCVCDDNVKNGKQKLKKTDLLQHLLITIVAFITAFIMKSNMTPGNIQSKESLIAIVEEKKSIIRKD